ncbi:epoxyqueuosine reductase [Hypericibacter adhaerens]|uniref:Epoxyqueuosine reductase n=1 Tax=Hypericibacter adhaerens TaxID=2602016 RepID=A0A5J6MT39_9PROT|nr:tRNA epoxyqueuosine(34) reductase QueG [Hypericibacter adhaerens]QEX20509.1 epoxyqueuosine reductase [Hypericibacter adhaerens]
MLAPARPSTDDPKALIRDEALALGFDAVGFAPASQSERAREGLRDFLAQGMQGDMGWLADRREARADPRRLWPEARSVIVLAMNYGPAEDPLPLLAHRERGAISVYARGRDYHDLVKNRLKALARIMAERLGPSVKVFVDTAPVMEKPLAETAGIGWQGKHTNLVSREHGSWLFLGEIFTDLALEPDPAEADHCGQCRRCLDSCPTAAFPAPYRLDARRCISYLTIEHKGHIPRELRAPMGNRIYGCDDCLAVCPWNKFASASRHEAFWPRAEIAAPRLADLAELGDPGFRSLFAGTAVKRTGRDRFLRNVLIAIGNSGEASLAAVVLRRLEDPSPLVRAMAVWALGRLLDAPDFDALRDRRLPLESDAGVRAEWQGEDAAGL